MRAAADPLPRVLLIADGFAGPDGPRVRAHTLAAVRAGVRWVQLRDHHAADDAFASGAARLAESLRAEAPEVVLQVNTRTEVAARLAAGLHVGRRGPAVAAAVRLAPAGPVTAAVHDELAARLAAASGVAAVVFSPVFATASKPGAPPAGLDALRRVCAAVSAPVMALGGVTPERVGDCLASGAWGVAVVRAILTAGDPAAEAARFVEAAAG
jgi:thiamine-phosphate pyrophosphorylase